MKKCLVSLALAMLLLTVVPLSAFATSGFNQRVFDGQDNITVSSDEMEGLTFVTPYRPYYNSSFSLFDDASMVFTTPGIVLGDSFDAYNLSFDYYGRNWVGMNEIIFKIGDNRYSFSNCYTSHAVTEDGSVSESISFYAKNQTKDFMKDFANHRNDEIKVRINGSFQTLDFVLSDASKSSILDLYDLYVFGGGTRESNMFKVTEADTVHVEKNGKQVIGNVATTVLDLAVGRVPA